jgi:hypothetical protein
VEAAGTDIRKVLEGSWRKVEVSQSTPHAAIHNGDLDALTLI